MVQPMLKSVVKWFQNPKARPRRKRGIKISTCGEFFDLREIFDEVNKAYFQGKLSLVITWAGNRDSKPRTRVMFGSYDREREIIKIHRRLDRAHIPRYFIAFVIYHEMLHHILPPIISKRRRRRIHHPEFTQKEQEFHDYAHVKKFQKEMRATWFKGDYDN